MNNNDLDKLHDNATSETSWELKYGFFLWLGGVVLSLSCLGFFAWAIYRLVTLAEHVFT